MQPIKPSESCLEERCQMPVFKVFDNNYDIKVDIPNSDDEYRSEALIFLKRGIMHETVFQDEENPEYDDGVEVFHAIRECSENGLMIWEDGVWQPVDDRIQKAYSDYIAEKVIL